MIDVEARAQALCAAPAGCAFLLIVEEAAMAPEVAARTVVASQVAALAVDEVRPWFPAHDRVVSMALEHGPRLLDLARGILAQPAATGWFGPIQRHAQQWATSPDKGESVPLPDPPSRPLSGWERYAQKPEWGLWTSTELDDTSMTSFLIGVAAGAGDLAATFQPPFARYRLTVSATARVFEIDGPAAWHHLCVRYATAGEDGRLTPDWPHVARDWDGVHLTLGGLLTAEQVRIEGTPGWTEHWAWDAEQTVWLRGVFDDVERLPDLLDLDDSHEWLDAPRALRIEPGPGTGPWLVAFGPEKG